MNCRAAIQTEPLTPLQALDRIDLLLGRTLSRFDEGEASKAEIAARIAEAQAIAMLAAAHGRRRERGQ